MSRTTRQLTLGAYVTMALFPLQLSAAASHDCHASSSTVSAPAAEERAGHGTQKHGSHGTASDSHHESASPQHASHYDPSNTAEWQVEGRYLDACRCNAPCPCHFGVRADYDSCDPTLVFHITRGSVGEVRLDGLTAVVVASRDMARLYIDDRGDPAQREALENVAREMTGTLLRQGFELPADQAVSARPIRAALTDERAEVSIPDVLDLSAGWLVGGDGDTRIALQNLNLGPSWMEQAWAGRSEAYRYSDAATWDYGGRNAYFGRFKAGSVQEEPSNPGQR